MAGPLAGIRVIDLTHEWAGPHAARLLADFGAEVLKIEYFRRLDHMRGARKDDRMFDKHARFLQLNRNKRSVPLDLKEERDRSIFEDLVRRADVVICNSRPGVLERLGFGYDRLTALKPDIILASLSACGQTGPDRGYAGYGGGIEATAGVQCLTAYTHDGEPRRIREMDVTNGIGAAAAVLTALAARRRTGRGTWIDLSEVEFPAYSLVGESLMEYARAGTSTLPIGNRHPDRVRGCYPCDGEDAWVTLSITDDRAWRSLCEVIGRPELAADERYADRDVRAVHHDEIDTLIAEWTRRRGKFDAMMLLQQAGVAAGAVMNAADLHRDPHLAARGYFRPPSAEPAGRNFSGMPFVMSRGGGEVVRSAPPLGEGSRDIVCGLLGRPSTDARTLALDDIGTDFDVEA
jgi:crotonobetainyl-CoA:carnitine CoA-transferase CaiB-like acyl-CoA transferase